MKKAVLEGVREKVKGINSQQLMMRVVVIFNIGNVERWIIN
jgi:hypothetical protein